MAREPPTARALPMAMAREPAMVPLMGPGRTPTGFATTNLWCTGNTGRKNRLPLTMMNPGGAVKKGEPHPDIHGEESHGDWDQSGGGDQAIGGGGGAAKPEGWFCSAWTCCSSARMRPSRSPGLAGGLAAGLGAAADSSTCRATCTFDTLASGAGARFEKTVVPCSSVHL